MHRQHSFEYLVSLSSFGPFLMLFGVNLIICNCGLISRVWNSVFRANFLVAFGRGAQYPFGIWSSSTAAHVLSKFPQIKRIILEEDSKRHFAPLEMEAVLGCCWSMCMQLGVFLVLLMRSDFCLFLRVLF